jgi:outer membrane protein, multidrug efflux system
VLTTFLAFVSRPDPLVIGHGTGGSEPSVGTAEALGNQVAPFPGFPAVDDLSERTAGKGCFSRTTPMIVVRSSNSKRFQSATWRALVLGGALFLPSCQIPDLCGPERGRSLPTDFQGTTTSENSACVGFDEFFNDPILTCLIVEGLNGNQELKILWQEVQIANNEVLKRRGAIFPFVTLGTRAGLEKSSRFTRAGAVESQLNVAPGKGFPEPLPNFLVAANVSWEVDIWRALRNARDAQALRYLGTNDGRNYVVTRLVAEIAENYYGLMALDKRQETLDQTISLQEQSLELAKAKKEAGRGTELAVQRFQGDYRSRKPDQLPPRPLPATSRTHLDGFHQSQPAHSEGRRSFAASSKPT